MKLVILYVFLATLVYGEELRTYYIDSFCHRRSSICECDKLDLNCSDNVRVDVRNKLANCSLLSLSYSQFCTIPQDAALLAESCRDMIVQRSHVKWIRKRDFYTGSSENSTITTIILDDNEIEDVPSKVFEFVPNLRRLQLMNNSISNLEENCFYGLKKLLELRLEGNELRTINEGILAPLESLERITLNNNKLEYLPENTFSRNLNLFSVDLGGNNLKIVDERVVTNHRALECFLKNFSSSTNITNAAIFQHSSIEFLTLDGNTVPYISSKTFAKTPKLRYLSAYKVNLFFVEREAFQRQAPLRNLNLSHNNLDSFDVDLPRNYGKNKIVTHVDLRGMELCNIPYTIYTRCSKIEINYDASWECFQKHRNESFSTKSEAGESRKCNSCRMRDPLYYLIVTIITLLSFYSLILTLYCYYYNKKTMKERLYYVIDDTDPSLALPEEKQTY